MSAAIKMLRGRLGYHRPDQPAPRLVDIHPAHKRSEEVEGLMLMQFVRLQWSLVGSALIHIPNEGGSGNAGAIRSMKLKAQGAQAGVSDYFYARPTPGLGGLWMELKAAHGKPSPVQVDFLLRMQKAGYAACFAYGHAAAASALVAYSRADW